MRNPYYRLAKTFKTHKKKFWKVVPFSVFIFFLFTVLGYFYEGEVKIESGKSIFVLLGLIAFIPTFSLYILIPLSKTFTRLDDERGVYKNHKLQEYVYTIAYTTIIVLTVIFILASIFHGIGIINII